MSKKGRVCRETERFLLKALEEPIAWGELTQRKLDNLRLKLADMTFGHFVRVDDSELPEVKIFITRLHDVDWFLGALSRQLKYLKRDLKLNGQVLVAFDDWRKAFSVHLAGRSIGG